MEALKRIEGLDLIAGTKDKMRVAELMERSEKQGEPWVVHMQVQRAGRVVYGDRRAAILPDAEAAHDGSTAEVGGPESHLSFDHQRIHEVDQGLRLTLACGQPCSGAGDIST